MVPWAYQGKENLWTLKLVKLFPENEFSGPKKVPRGSVDIQATQKCVEGV